MASTSTDTRYKLVFYVPPTHLPNIKTAIFETGAGNFPPKYSQVCFTTPGIGQFKPGADANPVIGTRGEVAEVGEVRCEITCNGKEIVQNAIVALKATHPYEVPVYEVYKLEDF